jgi:flagellar biosynthesis protein FlhF
MKMKTFQADTMQEALNLVKDEMGPDAVILKSRRATRRVGVKMQGCFEVTAALEEPLTNRAPAQPARPEPLQPARPSPRPMQGRIPPASHYDWRGSLRRVEGDASAEPANPAEAIRSARATARASEAADRRVSPISAPPGSERRAPAAPVRSAQRTDISASRDIAEAEADRKVIDMLRGELKALQEKAEMPARELKGLKDEIKAMMESAAARVAASHAQPAPAPRQFGRAISPAAGWITSSEMQALQEGLVELEMEPSLAAEAAGTAFAALRAATPVELAGAPAGEREIGFLTRALSERIRVSGGIRLHAGRPTTVALVGPTGVGKTTTLAKLAALAKIQQGKKVGIISADSFRMGANEQLEIFGRTAGIPVKSVFSPDDVAKAQREFADRDLILVDTAGRSHGHKEMWRELQGLLHCLAPDEIHLVLSGPTRMRELWHQYGLYRDLGASSLIFTKLDECLSLGCIYNLARRAEAPVAYLCNGQVIPDHILLARADLLAGALAEAARAALPAAGAVPSAAGGTTLAMGATTWASGAPRSAAGATAGARA